MNTAATPNAFVRRLRAPGYLIFGIAMVLPLLDLFVSLIPLRPATVMWRYGAVGFLSSAISVPLLMIFLVYALAYFSGDRKTMILCAILATVITLLMIGGAGTFALDALQMKRRIQEAAQPRFMLTSGMALVKLVLEGLAALVLAVSVFRTLNGAKAASTIRTESRPSSSLLMGRTSGARSVSAEVAQIPGPAHKPRDESGARRP